ncbi:MAG: fibronectin type III domain-containing protein [Candidatus Roizmanbacteria bacterium]|nr:fibronectin type III domain-containing protein [Candidatus Roizmanbacteria bacterium]MCR4313098.1 fibronectin type III domain-containing protein [Candidatus Roizmanbacteria bacterium]
MKNVLFRIGLVVFVFALLVVVPHNFNLIFGYAAGTPGCTNEKPAQVVLYEPNHALLPKATGAGEVRLNWLKATRANKYTIGFGTSSGNYIYGAANIADTNNYTVGHLNPGTRYYFAVKGVNGCMPGDWSREWSAVVGRGGGTSTLTYTGSRDTGSVVPSIVLKKQGTGGGNVVPTVVVPSVVEQNLPLVAEPTPKIGFFQKILNFLLGR